MLNIGLIGCGTHAHWAVIPALLASSDCVRFVAASDLQQANLDKLQAPGIAKYTDYRQMLAECKLDAVYLATLSSVREKIAIDALTAGLHVMCEKPMATDAAACRRMVDAAKKAGKLIGVNFEVRFYSWVRQARKWINAGRLGRIEAIHILDMWDGHKSFGELAPRRRRLVEVAGGLDCGIHRADLARFLAGGEWRDIEAYGAWFGEAVDPPPHVSVLARLDSGAHFSLTSSMGYTAHIEPKAFLETIVFAGDRGVIQYTEGTDRKIRVELASADEATVLEDTHLAHSAIMPAVIREFAARIEGRPHDNILATGEDGLAAQQFVERANASAMARRTA